MINDNHSDRNRFIDGILIVVAIGLLVTSIFSVYSAWRTGLAQSRAETASKLMAIQTAPRSTETPGINAWVSWALQNNSLDGLGDGNQLLRTLIAPSSGDQFPAEFRALLDVLQRPAPTSVSPVEIEHFPATDSIGGKDKLEFRSVVHIKSQDESLVLTARNESAFPSRIEPFATLSSAHLIAIKTMWMARPNLSALDHVAQIRSAKVARFYVLNEDESFISLPLGEELDPPGDREVQRSEANEFQKNPLSPTFVSNNFFFNFRYSEPLNEQAIFSGLYLDLGGLGLVASVTTPVIYKGKRCVLGADVALDIDWEEFARNLSPNLISHVVQVDQNDSDIWNPWQSFIAEIPASKHVLRNAIGDLASRETQNAAGTARKSIYITTAGDGGNVIAIQVNRSTWLLVLVAADEIQLPWATMLLTGFVFLGLVVRIELGRRNAVTAQRTARAEMQEKQNLLDTMQVPLMVVDPNSDEVVFCNRAANAIGMSEGAFFGNDIVALDEDAQRHYRQTQTLGEAHRRAYGVPIRIEGAGLEDSLDGGISSGSTVVRHAIIRSVAVTAPIASLHADERHRLGILFLIDEDIDLSLLLRHRLSTTRRDEKRRLSGLMNHGVDSLARVLKNQLLTYSEQLDDESGGEAKLGMAKWLSGYLSERIQLLAWILENWGEHPTTTDQRIIQQRNVTMTIDQYRQIFSIVASDRELREQLHWNNGAIANLPGGDQSPSMLEVEIDWDDDSYFSVPRDGLFGFFMGEVLINAVRHGKTGSLIRIKILQNRHRNEFEFQVTNDIDPRNARLAPGLGKPFGGLAILDEIARLSGWSTPRHRVVDGNFQLEWTLPAVRLKTDGEAD